MAYQSAGVPREYGGGVEDPPEPRESSYTPDDEAFLLQARQRYEFDLEVDREDREASEDDNKFANADDKKREQWDKDAAASRRAAGRPVVQWNRLPTYVQQVSNDSRQNKPSIKIAAGDQGRKETADYFQSRIRQVEYDSDADIAYDTSADQQVTSGRGNIRVFTERVPNTFEQRLRIGRIENQYSVVWDAGAKLYDRSDADHCFVVSQLTTEQHIREYGEQRTATRIDFTRGELNPAPQWIGIGTNGDMIQVAEYWVKERKKRMLCLLGSTGLPAWKDELANYDELKRRGLILAEREDDDIVIFQYVINGCEILSKTEWIGKSIPIVPVWGREAVVDGQRRTFSLIRNAKDPQRGLNLMVSNFMEEIGKMTKTPWLIPDGGVAAAHQGDWETALNTAKAYLIYQQYEDPNVGVRQLNKPERITNAPDIAGIVVGINQCIEAIKASMGIYDAALGARSNETSGIAIQRRQKESDVATFHFPDNQARSRKRVGELLLELIPLVDQPGKQYPVRSEEGKTRIVPIGKEHLDPKTGKPIIHNLTQGNYGVTVETGPSFTSARQEQKENLATIITAIPEAFWILGDKWIGLQDFPGSEEDAERVRRAIEMKTPGLIQDPEQQGQAIPPQVQAELMKAKQDAQAATAFAQSLHEKIETETVKYDHQKEIEQMKLEFEREKLGIDSQVKMAISGLQADLGQLKLEIDALNKQNALSFADRQAQEQRGHEAEMADQQHSQALEQQNAASDAAIAQQENAAALQPEEQPNA